MPSKPHTRLPTGTVTFLFTDIDGLSTEFTAIRSLDARHTNHPSQLTSLIGL
jgi:hypothetical protein